MRTNQFHKGDTVVCTHGYPHWVGPFILKVTAVFSAQETPKIGILDCVKVDASCFRHATDEEAKTYKLIENPSDSFSSKKRTKIGEAVDHLYNKYFSGDISAPPPTDNYFEAPVSTYHREGTSNAKDDFLVRRVATKLGLNLLSEECVPNASIALASVRAQGFLTPTDARVFTNYGFPLIAQLAENFNIPSSTIMQAISHGDIITYRDVALALYSILNKVK